MPGIQLIGNKYVVRDPSRGYYKDGVWVAKWQEAAQYSGKRADEICRNLIRKAGY